MKYNLVVFTLCLTFFFTACVKEQKLVFQESNITTKDNTIVEINIPLASGDLLIASKINSVIESHIISSLRFSDSLEIENISINESINSFNEEFKNFKSDFPDSVQQWESQIDGEIMYRSSKIISFALTSYTNTGGAHGILVISFLNFDTQTGEIISNDALFSNMDIFNEIAEPFFKKEIEKIEVVFKNDTFMLPKNIGFNEEGLIMLYNTFEIAPYSAGIIEFTVPFETLTEVLKFN